MKNKFLMGLAVLFLCVGCGNNDASITTETTKPTDKPTVIEPTEVPTETPTEVPTTKPSETPTEIPSEDPTEKPIEYDKTKTVKDILEIGKTLASKVNDKGVAESDVNVEIELKSLAFYDAITTQQGYGDRYKILMADETGYIYLKTNFRNYSNFKKFITKHQVYRVRGNVSYYNGVVEITTHGDTQYLEGKDINVDLSKLSEIKTIEETYELIDSMKLNTKGSAINTLVTIEGRCLARDINNTNMFFGNEDWLIQTHGHDKITNGISKDHSYKITGAIAMKNFAPSIEIVEITPINKDISFDTTTAVSYTPDQLYSWEYEVDKNQNYPNYTNAFKHPIKVTGHVNLYSQENSGTMYDYLVLEKEPSEFTYTDYKEARANKTVFLANENCKKLVNPNENSCPLYKYVSNGQKIDTIMLPYLWNTLDYPMCYCYNHNPVA